jgi:hypothetical protein
VLVVSLGFGAQRAKAVPVTYDLISGSVTWLGSATTNLLSSDIALTSAGATIDFDPAALDMSNLFAQGADFSLVQTSASSDLLNTGPGAYVLLATPVTITSSLLGGTVPAELGGSNLLVTPDGLQISVTGVALGQQVKVDFDFRARSIDGATAIPEPGSELLFPAGLALLGWLLRLPRKEARC